MTSSRQILGVSERLEEALKLVSAADKEVRKMPNIAIGVHMSNAISAINSALTGLDLALGAACRREYTNRPTAVGRPIETQL